MKNHTVISVASAAKIIKQLKGQDRRIVFTNGCFDILHMGHIKYLKAAKELGDVLVVGVNSNRSVTKLKGKKRPIIDEKERAKVLSSLYFVDYVIIFNETTPTRLISRLKPDIHVKGGDYDIEDLPESSVVKANGGKVMILPYIKGKSTTEIISKILSLQGEKHNRA